MEKNVINLINEHIENSKLMQIATCMNDTPWIFNCWYTYDNKENTFYFISRPNKKHSQQIAQNPLVACSIIKEIPLKLGDKVQGLHFEGTAHEIKINLLPALIPKFIARWKFAKEILSFDRIKSGLTDARLYEIKPIKWVWFDEINFPEDPRQEIKITIS